MSELREDTAVALSMRGVAKSFGGVQAIRNADLEVSVAEVHALLGENGAGKSTLMNILSGIVQPDAGEIRVAGEVVAFGSPSAAHAGGVAMIHQELDLVPGATVSENLFLGREPRTRIGALDRGSMNRQTSEVLARIGADFSPNREVGSMRVGEQQMVAIAKALSQDARILVMDEPTSALSDTEVESLMALIPRLRDAGVGIIFISHRMDEISRIADRATVMRDGQTVETFDVATTPPAQIITNMIGRPIEQLFPERMPPRDAPVLQVDSLTVEAGRSGGRAEPKDVSFLVREGEIVGLAGLLGAGRSELLEALYGRSSGKLAGTVSIAGSPVGIRSPRQALASGIGYVPEDRRVDGLVMSDSIGINILLSALKKISPSGWRSRRREAGAVRESITQLGVKTSNSNLRVDSLSGGNQQKVVFARQLRRNPRLLLLDEPTRGVDIGAKAEIYRLLADLAADGMGVLMASSELPELVGICDRVLVLRDGRIVAELAGESLTPAAILAAAGLGDAGPDADSVPAGLGDADPDTDSVPAGLGNANPDADSAAPGLRSVNPHTAAAADPRHPTDAPDRNHPTDQSHRNGDRPS